jgi:hypothetical protein
LKKMIDFSFEKRKNFPFNPIHKVVGLKGKRQISALQATERGAVITVVTCMSPAGHLVPPLVTFPGKNYEARTNAWYTSWVRLCLPPVWQGTGGYIHRLVSSLHLQ